MTLGLGRAAIVKIPTNDRYELDPAALEAAIARDRAAGRLPIAIVATIGTTSSTSVDPVAPVADIAEREGLWLHVDSAYAGVVALLPDRRAPFAGWERADSIVVNPHKWLFTPLDASSDAPDGPAARRVQPRAGVPAHPRPRQPGPRLQRVPAPARAPDASAQAVDAAALVRARGDPAADRVPPCPGGAVRGLDRRRPGLGAARPAPFSTVCFRYGRRASSTARTSPMRAPGSTPSTLP